MEERWERSSGNSILSNSWRMKLPYQECPNCGEYKYTTHKRKIDYKTSPDAGQVVSHKMAEVFIDSCDNCSLMENKRLKIFMNEIENLSSYKIDKLDRNTKLNGFTEVDFMPKEENLI